VREEILVGRLGLGSVALQGVGTGEAEMSKRACGAIPQQPAMVEDFLEFSGRELALLGLPEMRCFRVCPSRNSIAMKG
jgi:hypothetical protein